MKSTNKQPQAEPPVDGEEDEAEDECTGEDMLEMMDPEDAEFLKQAVAGNSYSMFSGLQIGYILNFYSEKRKNTDEDIEDEYEKGLEGMETKRMRHLLPIKSDTGIIRRAMFEEQEDAMEEEQAAQPSEPEDKKIKDTFSDKKKLKDTGIEDTLADKDLTRPVSVVEMVAWRREAVAKCKFRIGVLASSLLEDPEANIVNLTRLLELWDEWRPETSVTLKKLLATSLLEVFKDILPAYQIKHDDQAGAGVKLKKDTRMLQTYEKRLLKGYKTYLTRLEKMASKLYRRKGDTREVTGREVALGELAVDCLGQLLCAHPYFNYSANIVQLLTPYLDNSRPSVRTVVTSAFTEVFRQDKRGDITLQIVRRINDLVKKRKHVVKREVVSVLSSLQLIDLNLDDPKKAEAEHKKALAKKKRIMNLSKREKKKKKRLEEVEKELLETKAEENKNRRESVLTEVTKYVFTVYFRMLKTAPSCGLVGEALRGISKFAHCINLDFYEDLVMLLNRLMQSEGANLRLSERLHCQSTVFTILSGHGEAFNIDPNKFYGHLYSTMIQMDAARTKNELIEVLVDCLCKVILGRRKKLTRQQLLAFIKRTATISLYHTHPTVLALLAILKQIFQYQRSVDSLLEVDATTGQGVFLPQLDDPEHCNATSTSLFELAALRRHYHPTVRKMACHIAAGVPATGDHSLPADVAKM
ncbi:hypothetical protein AAG570_005030 [Ranatra chinensis]|uniref:NOC3-like protein n=1 Tax=Ranatra chinensis TaxID=642074 RepID=A0ABD0XZK9_9HEMI